MLEEYIAHFLKPGVVPADDWVRDLKNVQLSYSGEEVKTAQMLTLDLIKLALPPKGSAAAIRAADIADEPMKSLLLDPEKSMKPRSGWPESPRTAKVFAEDAEWVRIVRHLVELGIFGLMKKSQVFHYNHKPVLNGAFRVSKNKFEQVVDENKGGTKTVELLRFIVNLTPFNAIMNIIAADIRTLPYGGQWSGVMLLPDGQVAVFSDEDLTCAFYLFDLEEWMPYQALSKTVSGRDMLGLPQVKKELLDEPELFVGVRALAMGHRQHRGYSSICIGGW